MTSEDFYRELTEQINRQIEPIYGFRVTLISYDSQGDFYWFYENLDGIFNQGTFDYVSARVSPYDIRGVAQISPAGGFPNAYIQVVTAIYYQLSPADEARLQKAVADASAQAIEVIKSYQGLFGTITEDQMAAAQTALGTTAVANKQDYVIGFAMGYLWSGRLEQNQPALAYTEMERAPDLPLLLPRMPALGQPVLEAAQQYLRLLGPANALEDQMFLGGWTIAQLRNNTAHPAAASGGMRTVNPNTGAVSPDDQVAYGVGVTIAAIQRELNDTSRVVRAVIQVSWDKPADSIASLLHLHLADGSRLALLPLLGENGEATVEITYRGYSRVPTAPAGWQSETSTGWFDGGPIAEASRNGNSTASGFRFTTPPGYNLGPLAAGGDFGLITDLLISNPPEVVIHSPQAKLDLSALAALGHLSLFGPKRRPPFPLYSVTWSPLPDGGAALRLSPLQAAASPLQQTAYVMGGAFDFPGAGGLLSGKPRQSGRTQGW
jgi:hypothetical protein